MNKPEFVDYVAEELGTTKKDTKVYVDAIFDSIAALLDQGEEVNFNGFGKFTMENVEAATRRNPRTGESVKVEAHRKPKFKFSSTLKSGLR